MEVTELELKQVVEMQQIPLTTEVVGVVVEQPYRRRAGEPDTDELFKWTAEEVAQWLTNTAQESDEAAKVFLRHQVTGVSLQDLDENTMREMGFAVVGQRKQILRKVKQLMKSAAMAWRVSYARDFWRVPVPVGGRTTCSVAS